MSYSVKWITTLWVRATVWFPNLSCRPQPHLTWMLLGSFFHHEWQNNHRHIANRVDMVFHHSHWRLMYWHMNISVQWENKPSLAEGRFSLEKLSANYRQTINVGLRSAFEGAAQENEITVDGYSSTRLIAICYWLTGIVKLCLLFNLGRVDVL